MLTIPENFTDFLKSIDGKDFKMQNLEINTI